MIKETITLTVKYKISYPDKNDRAEAIKTAKENAVCSSTLGLISAEPIKKSAKILKK